MFNYKNRDSDNKYEIRSSLSVKGEDAQDTAMAKTVGLPLAIVSKLILNNKISKRGTMIPVEREVYIPVLDELKKYGIFFHEENHASSLSL